MTAWVKLDDDYYDHAKFAQCGPMAELLWIRMLAWSHRNLTDGLVPVRAIKRLADFTREVVEMDLDSKALSGPIPEATWLLLVDRLVGAGLLDEEGDVYRIHDYLAKQTSAETVDKRRAAGQRGGIKSGERRQKWQPNEATGAIVLKQNGKPRPSKNEANGQPDSRFQISDVEDIPPYPPETHTPKPGEGWGKFEATGPNETMETRDRRRGLALRWQSVLAERGVKAGHRECNEVVAKALHLVDWKVVDETIGWFLEATVAPRSPNVLESAVSRKAYR